MQSFEVEDDLVELVWKLANPKPFESLTFSAALRRVLSPSASTGSDPTKKEKPLDELLAELIANSPSGPKKAPTPSPSEWVASVPELKKKTYLTTWKAICDELNIDPAGDSARRKLKVWAATHRPSWPAVPEPGLESA